MSLSSFRVLVQGQTPHPHEQEAIEFIKKQLHDAEPYRLWALVDLTEPFPDAGPQVYPAIECARLQVLAGLEGEQP